MDKIEVINVLKRYCDKKTERERESAVIWSCIAHSWTGRNYMCKAKYETLGS